MHGVQPGKEGGEGPLDLTLLTCTNLTIRLKILLKRLPPGEPLEFIVRRDQRDTIDEPFTRAGFVVTVLKIERNRFLVRMKKKATGGSA